MRNVVIVGAGFAGLAAAKSLVTAGGEDVTVTVLEGGSRVGGRANTQTLEGLGKVEFGATYLHGTKDHFIYKVAQDAGLLGPVHTKELRWGFVRPGAQAVVAEDTFDKVQKAVKAYAAARDSAEENGATLGAKLAKAAKQELARLDPEEQRLFLQAWRWHEVQMMVNTSSPSSADVSSAWWEVCDDLEGPNFPIPAGFQTVAEVVAEGLNIRYNSIVTAIQWEGSGATVCTADGHHFSADAVIVTVSLGVLKAEHKALFHPPLPERKAAAIENLGWGHNEKIILEFGSPPCLQSPPDQPPAAAYNLLWDVAWPGPQEEQVLSQQPSGDRLPSWAPGIFSFRFGGSEFKPASVPTSNSHEVDPFGAKYCSEPGRFFGNSSIEMAYLAASCPQSQPQDMPTAPQLPRAACLWVSGWHAVALAEASDEEVRDGVAAVLQQFPAIPLGDGQPKRIWRSSWTKDPLFRGAYSFVSAQSSPADNEALAEPVLGLDGMPLLLFAGEATTATKTSSTNGAFMTGRREAQRLLAAWRGSPNGNTNGTANGH